MPRPLLRITLALALLAAGSAEAYQPQWFRTSFSDHANAHSIGAGDFNSDGRPDVVTRTSGTTVDLWLTNANGTLGFPVSVHTASNLTNLLVADVNADGKVDVILSQRTPHTLVVLPSNGDGTFGTAVTTAVAVDPTAGRFAVADFNGDANVDVVIGSHYDLQAEIYAGDGDGTFTLLFNRSLPSAPWVVSAGDIDADGNADYVVGYNDASPYEVHFGNGDGTFLTVYPLFSVATGAARIALADLDADGDREIILPHFETNALSVVLNNGSRTFASPVVYDVLPVTPPSGNPWDIVVADVSDDGHLDVVLTLANEHLLATYTGNGDGSLNPGAYQPAGSTPYGQSYSPRQLAGADFNGDGRVDLALAGSVFVAMWNNVSGDVLGNHAAVHPTITEGDTARFTVYLSNAVIGQSSITYPLPPVTGTVTFKREGVEVGSGVLDEYGNVRVEVPSLSLGTHTITAHYSGDDSYRATELGSATVNVIAESTTVMLTSSGAGTEVAFGQAIAITAEVTSEVAGPIDGVLRLYLDGVEIDYGSAPKATWQIESIPAGTHTLHARYDGSETQPAGTSAYLTQVIKKAASVTSLQYTQAIVRYSQQTSVQAGVSGVPNGPAPGGNVQLYEGSTLLATVVADSSCCLGGVPVTLPISLPVGIHYVHVAYEGNENFEASTSELMEYVVFPDDGFIIDAWWQGGEILVHTMYQPPSGGQLRIRRWVGTASPTFFPLYSPSFRETSPEPGTPYVYRMEAYSSTNELLATSNTVLEMLFTDEPLQAGTVVKSVHLTELVASTNALRNAGGLGAIAIDTAAGQVIRATHVLELRSAINEARLALGAAAIAFSSDVAPGSAVKAAHIQQLRDAIR